MAQQSVVRLLVGSSQDGIGASSHCTSLINIKFIFNTSFATLPPHLLMAQVRHRATNSTIDPDDLIEALWNVLKPCARKLRDIIMQNIFPTRFPPGLELPSTQAKVPSLTTRRAACTHLTMGRLYGNFRCNVCHRASELGWVYTCIQDDEAAIIEAFESREGKKTQGSDSPLDDVHHDLQDTGKDSSMLTTRLNPWVEKAIVEGHYTDEQVAVLRAQKQKVFDTATAAIQTFEQSQNEIYSLSQATATSPSVDPNPHLPFPVIHESHEASNTDRFLRKGSFESPRLQMFPHCKFRACQLCRPTYRDRTWLCFDEVFRMPMPFRVPGLEDENRPLASLPVMRNIGLRKPRRQTPRPRLRKFDSRTVYEFSEDGTIVLSRKSSDHAASDTAVQSSDIADATLEPESRGFRESMKRAFRGMLAARQTSTRVGGRRRRTRESTTSDEDAAEFDMGLWQEMNDELLNDASSVPLPVKDSIDGFADGILDQVEETDIGGVAVTEEAADLHAADIIMSV